MKMCMLVGGSITIPESQALCSQVYAVFGDASFKATGSSKLEPSLWDTLMTTYSRSARTGLNNYKFY